MNPPPISKRRLWAAAAGAAIAGASVAARASAASIFTNPITDANPSTANPYTNGQTLDPKLTVTGIGRGPGLTPSAAANRYSASGFPTAPSLNANDYFTFTLTPQSGYEINFADFVYTGQASGTGPKTVAFESSLDGFTSTIGTPTVTGSTLDLSGPAYQAVTGPVEFRLYGFGGTSAAGTFSVNDFTFDGAVVQAPAGVTGNLTFDPTGTAGGTAGRTFDRSTANFRDGGLGTDVTYKDGNTVNFTDAGVGAVAVQANGVRPAAVNVSNTTGTYTFGGGPIAGSATLTKTGAGTLALTASNTYTGGTRLNGGTLSITDGSQLGATTSPVSFDGGTLALAGQGVGVSNPISLTSRGTVEMENGYFGALTGVISGGGTLVLAGDGFLSLSSGANTYGNTVVNAGTLNVFTGGLGTGTVTVDGATARFQNNDQDLITSADGLTLGPNGGTVGAFADLALNGNLTGGTADSTTGYGLSKIGIGTLTLGVTTGGSYIGSLGFTLGYIKLVGTSTTPTAVTEFYGIGLPGTTTGLTVGGTSGQAVALRLSHSASVGGTGALTINPGSQLVGYSNDPARVPYNEVDAPVTLVSDGTTVPTLAGAQFGTLYISSVISGTSGVQIGATTPFDSSTNTFGPVTADSLVGKVEVAGSNTYTGNTTVVAGTLEVDRVGSTSSGTVTVNAPFSAGGTRLSPTLAGVGTINGPVVLAGTITGGSGATTADFAGQLTLLGGLTVNNGAYVVKFDPSLASPAATGTGGSGTADTLVLGALTINGTLTVDPLTVNPLFASGTSFAAGSFYSYVIADDTASPTALDSLLGQITVAAGGPANGYSLATMPDGNGGEDLLLEFTAAAAPDDAPGPGARGRHRVASAHRIEFRGDRALSGQLVRRLAGRAAAPLRQEQRGDGRGSHTRRADPDRRSHTRDEGRSAGVAAMGGEHRAEHGDPQDAAELTDRVVGTGGDALLVAAHRAEHDVGDGDDEQRHPEAGDHEGRHHREVRNGGAGHGGQPAQPDGLQGQPGDQQRPAADAVRQCARDRGYEHRHPGPGQRPQPGFQRAVVLDDLQELSEQEDRAEHPEEHQQRRRVGQGEAAAAEQVHRQHRLAGPQFPGHEPGHQKRAGHDGGQYGGAGPAVGVAADDAVHDAQQAQAGQHHAGQVQAGGQPAALGEPGPGDGQQREADRHVQPEDPLPRGAFDDCPADQRADGDGQAADRTPDAQGHPAALRGHRRREQGQGQRDDHGRPDALHGPRGETPCRPTNSMRPALPDLAGPGGGLPPPPR